MEKRHSRSRGRRSSILKVDNINRDDDTCTTGILFKGRRSSRRVSFAETYQVKEFPKDSPSVYRRVSEEDEDSSGSSQEGDLLRNCATVTGLDKLLTGAIQTPYEHITECPIPEMSSDSLNTSKLFDINRTVLGQVDMDMTDVVDSPAIDMPFMEAEQDFSKEIKFDSASFLRNLKGKPSDCLKSMQIFSPNSQYSNFKENVVPALSVDLMNGRSPLQCIPHEVDNIVLPEAPVYLSDSNDFEFEQKKDAKSFLSNLFGPKLSTTGKTISEEIAPNVNDNSIEDSMDETTCYGGIVGKDAVKELTNQITAKMDGQDKQIKRQPFGDIPIQDPEVTTNQTLVMEETKCVGDILNKSGSVAHNRNFSFHEKENLSPANQTLKMEETACIGGLMNQTLSQRVESKRLSDEATKIFQFNDMDETKCQGGILNKTNFTADFGQLNISRTQYGADMEETKCLTGFINRTVNEEPVISDGRKLNEYLKTEKLDNLYETKVYQSGQDMEETKCVTELINKTATNEHENRTKLNTTVKEEEQVVQSDHMDKETESPSVPVVTVNKAEEQAQIDLQPHLHLPNHTPSMEETKCVGGITNKSILRDVNLSQADMTKACPTEMEETKCHGGILNRTGAASELKTVEMVETKFVGGIMNKTCAEELCLKPNPDLTKVYQNFDMEETKSRGGILNQTNVENELKMANKTEFDESACRAQLDDNNEDNDSGEITFNFKSDLPKDNEGNKFFGNQSMPMKETKCIGKLLNKGDCLERDGAKAVSAHEPTVHHTVLMEETKCLGGLKGGETREITIKYGNDKTVNLTSSMEMTRCGDSLNNIDTGIGTQNRDRQSLFETMDTSEVAVGIPKDSERNIEMDTGNVENENHVGRLDEMASSVLNRESPGIDNNDESKLFQQGMEEMDQDNEIDKDSGDANFPEETTRETTQSLARLQKLRGMLIMSKKKTPTHFKRPAEPKTDISSPRLYPEEIRSPAHKKKKLFDNPMADISIAVDRTLSASDLGCFINDEQMPDLMKMDDLMSVTGSPLASNTIRGIDDTFKTYDSPNSGILSTSRLKNKDDLITAEPTLTLRSSNNTSSTEPSEGLGGRKRRLPSGSTQSTDTMTSSGNKDMSVCQRSFYSFMSESVIVPGVPVTLDMFKKAMMIKSSLLVKNSGRRSSFMAPRVDTDDVGEVLLAELTLAPEVKATMAAYEDIKHRTNSNEETARQLQADLEETQPPIFQDCVELEGAELQSLRTRVNELHKNCHKLSRLNWVIRTKEAASQPLAAIQDKGLSSVSSILEDIRSDQQQTDRLIKSIDDDLEDFLKTTHQLGELEEEKNNLESELETVLEAVEKQEEIQEELSSQLGQQVQEDHILSNVEDMKDLIRTHLFCQEWDLVSLDESCAEFTFLEQELELVIRFSKIGETLTIQSVHIQSHLSPGCSKLSKRLAHSMALAGVNTEMLQNKYCSFESLPELLYEVSGVMSEIREFCEDVQQLDLSHDIKVDHRRIHCDFWSLKTLDEISVQLDFSPDSPLSTPAHIDVTVIMGSVLPQKIQEDLQSVKTGKHYLARLFAAVQFE